MPFRICIVGCGGLSNRAHGPSFRRYAETHDDVELAACCDLDPERAERYRTTFGFLRAYSDYGDMLDRETPDAVCLMAPVDKTCELSCAIMKRGFPLLMEKPPGLDPDECRAMIHAAEQSGMPNQVAFNRRYTPLMKNLKQRLKTAVDNQPLQNIRYDFFRINRRDADFATTAIHGIDAVRFIADTAYEEVRFHYQLFPELGPAVANIFMDCTFESGATGQLNFCPVTGVVIERATVTLYDHTLFLDTPMWQAFDGHGRLQHVQRGRRIADVQGSAVRDSDEMFVESGFYGENESFFDDLRAGKRPEGDIQSGLQAVEIADCIRGRSTEYHA